MNPITTPAQYQAAQQTLAKWDHSVGDEADRLALQALVQDYEHGYTGSSTFDRIRSRTPLKTKVFVSKSLDLADALSQLLHERQCSYQEFCDDLGPECRQWFSGLHDFKLSEIAELEAKFGVDLLTIRGAPGGFFARHPVSDSPQPPASPSGHGVGLR